MSTIGKIVQEEVKLVGPIVKTGIEAYIFGYLGTKFVTFIDPLVGAVFTGVVALVHGFVSVQMQDRYKEVAQQDPSISRLPLIKFFATSIIPSKVSIFAGLVIAKALLPAFMLGNGLLILLTTLPFYIIYIGLSNGFTKTVR